MLFITKQFIKLHWPGDASTEFRAWKKRPVAVLHFGEMESDYYPFRMNINFGDLLVRNLTIVINGS